MLRTFFIYIPRAYKHQAIVSLVKTKKSISCFVSASVKVKRSRKILLLAIGKTAVLRCFRIEKKLFSLQVVGKPILKQFSSNDLAAVTLVVDPGDTWCWQARGQGRCPPDYRPRDLGISTLTNRCCRSVWAQRNSRERSSSTVVNNEITGFGEQCG